jgi:D-galactose 1-dehydrogenase
LPAIRGDSGFILTATVDPSVHGVGGVPHYASISEMLESEVIDAVAICTPPQNRCELAAVALQCGLHVLLEKPPGTSLSDCEALIPMARAANCSLFAAWHSRFAGGVEPARQWLSSRLLRRASITWHESVEKWHPGQEWIWQDGGFGVFDAGINALSIATHILPQPVSLRSAKLVTAADRKMPIAAELQFFAGQVSRVDASFDWRRAGTEIWNIEIETNEGGLLLSEGGASLTIDGERHEYLPGEYAGVYRRFRDLISARAIDCDLAPLSLVMDALKFQDGRDVSL